MDLSKILSEERYAYVKSMQKVDNKYNAERLLKSLPELRKAIAFYRQYPDIYIDDIKGSSNFEFYDYQRMILRIMLRHRYTYFTFSRGTSKSFINVLGKHCQAVLYPGCNLFITAGGKQQASSIAIAKLDEICKLIPALADDIDWTRGVSTKSRDEFKYQYLNGSTLSTLPPLESSRGQRRHGGAMEECVSIPAKALDEIIIPTTVINRRLPNGDRVPEEPINQSQVYITTAGTQDIYAYSRQIELLARSVVDPDEAMILGGSCHIPIIAGLQPENFIDNLRLQESFEEASFEREYMSTWTGAREGVYYSSNSINKNRTLLQPELEASKKITTGFYILGVDVGRKDCTSEVVVVKVSPKGANGYVKQLVCFYSLEAEHFEKQALIIKKLYYQYNARTIVVDGNGMGVGLLDFLVLPQVDSETGEEYPPFGIEDGTYSGAKSDYRKFITPDTVRNAVYVVKANATINSDAYTYVNAQLNNGKIKMLIDERDARVRLMETKWGQNATPEQRAEKLKPFLMTDNLKEQMVNLIEATEGANIILKQKSKKIPKDRFSAFAYAMYYIKLLEHKKKERTSGIADMMFFS